PAAAAGARLRGAGFVHPRLVGAADALVQARAAERRPGPVRHLRGGAAVTRPVQIWVDADACPGVIKDILFRAAERTKLPLTLVANRLLRVPPSPYIRARQVPMGFDVADRHIMD